jgi:hypothetical protein
MISDWHAFTIRETSMARKLIGLCLLATSFVASGLQAQTAPAATAPPAANPVDPAAI